jgi:adenylate cyclase
MEQLGDAVVAGMVAGLDAEAAAGRERLIRELHDRGFTVGVLREAIANDRLAVLPLEQVYREAIALTARDVAAACDLEVEEVLRFCHLLGVTPVTVDEPAFDDEAVASFQAFRLARASGMSQASIEELQSLLGRHMWQLACDVLIVMGNEFARSGDTEYELAHRYADAARLIGPAALPVVASAFQAHLRERMREIFVTPDEARHGALRAIAEVTVAFVDVVGFTELGERVEAGELKSVAARLVAAASALSEPPVRIVKTVGDAVMLASRESAPLIDVVVKLVPNLRVQSDVPPVHVGIARGPAHIGGADVYGASVNLASHLTDLAPANRIWVSQSVRVDVPDGVRFVAQGRRPVKGVTKPIAVFELQTAEQLE